MSLWGICGPAALGIMTKQVEVTEQGRLQGALGVWAASQVDWPGAVHKQFTFAYFVDGDHNFKVPGAAFMLASFLCIAAAIIAWGVAKPIFPRAQVDPMVC